MPSLIPGYEYDIFISYRQKDNKGERWVTEFANVLRTELESTFKEDISIYFDENPRDGLLETHNVDKSLEGKLKCLIFIPIISQTYCDPKSFAWANEFVAFNRSSRVDPIGRDIKLSNGNVASRILPVKIHDLDTEDKKLLESETENILRSVDFIYKSPGVNRPLKPNDERHENLNHTYYRDQINKVANAVKELIVGIKRFKSGDQSSKEVSQTSGQNQQYGYGGPKISRLLISSFRILHAGTEADFLAFSLPEAIAGSLSDLRDLSIQMDLAGMFNTISEMDIERLAHERKLNAAISGSILQVANEVRVTINLFELPAVRLLWTTTTQKRIENLFQLHDDIVQKILGSLKISLHPSEELDIDDLISKDPAVYPLFLKANQLSLQTNEWDKARDMYLECINMDSGFTPAWARVARCYRLIGKYADTMEECARNFAFAESAFQHALRLKPNFDQAHGLMAQLEVDFGKPIDAMKRLLMRIKGGSRGAYLFAGLVHCFRWVGLLEESLIADKIAKEIDPSIITSVGQTYWMMGAYDKATQYTIGDIGYLEGVSLSGLGQIDKAIESLAENEQKTTRETLKCYLRSLRFALAGDKINSVKNIEFAQTPGMDGEAMFYLLRTYAFLGDTKKAMDLIFKVMHKGFFPVSVFENDEWLQVLKENKKYNTFLMEARKLHAEARLIYNNILPDGLEANLIRLRTVQA